MMLQEEDPLWVQEDDGTLLNLPSLSRSHSNSHHDAEIMPWLPPYPPTLHRCFDDSPSSLVTGYGCRGKAYASAVINNAREEVLLCKDDREMKFNTACVEEPAEDDGMKKKKKNKSAGSEGGGITREGIMMMMMMNSRRESQILDEKDLLPPIDSEASPTKQSQKQHAPNRALIEALLPLPHGGGDEACMIVESSSSALSGRGSCSCMEGGEDLDAHCNINHSLIKDVNPKVADNLDCMARFNGVSDPSRGSGSTTEKSVKEVDRSSKRKISNAVDEFEGQSEPVEEEGVYMERKKTSSRFASSKGTRAAEVHNESERRRRDRINEKMRALQQIIPNANKTDKASMLDEAIAYLRYLQTQVQYLSMNLGPFMIPMGMQFQQNLSMGMGITDFGLGALNPTPHPQQHCLPGYHPNPPLSNATEDLECLQPPTNYNGSGNAMKSYSSSLIPPPHHQQWMQQVPTHEKHPPSVQVNMQQHQMQTPILQQLPLPSLQHVKAQMKQYAGEST